MAEATDVRAFLSVVLHGIKRSRMTQLLKFGAVTVNGLEVRRETHSLCAGDVVSIAFDGVRGTPGGGLTVVYQDPDIIVVDKPAGLLSIATDKERSQTAYALLNEWLKPGRVWIVHRLDQDTSGLLVLARSEEMKMRLQKGWPAVSKHYVAVVDGVLTTPSGTVRSFLRETESLQVVSSAAHVAGARQAITHYRVLRSGASHSLLEVHLETGRKHQIRVHLASLGHPVVGDRRYGAPANPIHRMALHAARLEFKHPRSGEVLRFSSPVPPPMEQLGSI